MQPASPIRHECLEYTPVLFCGGIAIKIILSGLVDDLNMPNTDRLFFFLVCPVGRSIRTGTRGTAASLYVKKTSSLLTF
ncbi:hypothetical protein OPV22_011824 [Ensete ventricosum]|uniref:Uncharacterized protein n=1 Tax=Ensete ventricosum TaxID=4639 RepID=A0AAV8RP18_ENSVE|nr:hypothetical protein OPV22_011824 [Ensete ventricosum]